MATTEADVLREALAQLSRPGGYNEVTYFAGQMRPGPNVYATCAIGGVEQAIWKLTGKAPTRDERYDVQEPVPQRRTLYARVMKRLNRVAREAYPDLLEHGEEPPRTIEELTFIGSHRTSRKRTLNVFKKALAEVSS